MRKPRGKLPGGLGSSGGQEAWPPRGPSPTPGTDQGPVCSWQTPGATPWDQRAGRQDGEPLTKKPFRGARPVLPAPPPHLPRVRAWGWAGSRRSWPGPVGGACCRAPPAGWELRLPAGSGLRGPRGAGKRQGSLAGNPQGPATVRLRQTRCEATALSTRERGRRAVPPVPRWGPGAPGRAAGGRASPIYVPIFSAVGDPDLTLQMGVRGRGAFLRSSPRRPSPGCQAGVTGRQRARQLPRRHPSSHARVPRHRVLSPWGRLAR